LNPRSTTTHLQTYKKIPLNKNNKNKHTITDRKSELTVQLSPFLLAEDQGYLEGLS